MSARNPRFDASMNYYQVLNVRFGAPKDEITRAYRQLMRLTHPDQFQDPDERGKAEERAKLINAAYAVLSKPDTRHAYDTLMRQTVMADTVLQRYTGSSPGGPSPLLTPPRPPSARVVQAQRAAFASAAKQILVVTTGFVLLVIAVFLTLSILVSVL